MLRPCTCPCVTGKQTLLLNTSLGARRNVSHKGCVARPLAALQFVSQSGHRASPSHVIPRKLRWQRTAAAKQEDVEVEDPKPVQVAGNIPVTEETLEQVREIEQQEAKIPMVAEQRWEVLGSFVAAAVAFGLGIGFFMGREKAEEFFAGYLLEQSLSVDNLFVFVLVFSYFKTARADQDKVLTYGILSAAGLRLVLILLGSELVERFNGIFIVFAGILLYSSYKLLQDPEEADEDLSNNGVVKLCRQFIKVSENYDGDKFFTMENGVRMATPLLLVLAVVELSDVVFAVDSIPAVFGVTTDPFIVYTSNMFAILSLRALYGFVATAMTELKYLDKAVALVLGFIGAKMLADFGGLHISTEVSLGVVASVLGAGVAGSLILKERE